MHRNKRSFEKRPESVLDGSRGGRAVGSGFRERRPVYGAYSRGCGLINDLFDSPLSSIADARMPRIERTIEFYVNTLVRERKPGSSA